MKISSTFFLIIFFVHESYEIETFYQLSQLTIHSHLFLKQNNVSGAGVRPGHISHVWQVQRHHWEVPGRVHQLHCPPPLGDLGGACLSRCTEYSRNFGRKQVGLMFIKEKYSKGLSFCSVEPKDLRKDQKLQSSTHYHISSDKF